MFVDVTCTCVCRVVWLDYWFIRLLKDMNHIWYTATTHPEIKQLSTVQPYHMVLQVVLSDLRHDVSRD